MDLYSMKASGTFEAIQFLDEDNRPDMIKLCKRSKSYNNEVVELSPRILGSVSGAFFAIRNGEQWDKIEIGDWIVKKDNFYAVVPNGLFKLLFNKSQF